MSHVLNILALSNFAQRKYVWVCRWTRMEKWRRCLTGWKIQLVSQIQSQPHGLNVYPADVVASPSSLLLIVFSTASPPHSSPLQSESRQPPPPPTHSLSSRVHWKSASAWKWCHREKEMKCCENEEHSGVIQHPPSSLPSFRDEAASHPTLSPLLPACCCSGLWDGDVIGCNVSFT